MKLQLSQRTEELAQCERSLQRALEKGKFDTRGKLEEVLRDREQAIYLRCEAEK